MPFFAADDSPLTSIELGQAPPDGYRFQLRAAIGYREPGTDATIWAPPHVPSDAPADGNRTDLASVPQFLWSFIASYGRQSAPAVIHDHRAVVALQLGDDDAALAQRKEDDRVFHVGLREQRVPRVRSRLMWAWVSVERHLRHAPGLAALMLVQVALSVAVICVAIVLALSNPLWLLLALVPLLASALWGQQWFLMAVLSYGSAFLLPLLLLHFAAVLPFRLLEFVVELVSGGRPTEVFRPTLR
ncbi:MAG: DUF1353 domain-containing protein [Leifsonia sp.]